MGSVREATGRMEKVRRWRTGEKGLRRRAEAGRRARGGRQGLQGCATAWIVQSQDVVWTSLRGLWCG